MISSTAKQKQQGTALTWVVSLFFIFMMVALVVDAGRIYHDKRQLQSLANQLATELAEGAQTCGGVSGGTDVSSIANARLSDLIDAGSAPEGVTVSYAELSLMERDNEKDEFAIYSVGGAEESNAVSLQLEKPVGGLLYFVVDEPLMAESTVRKEVVAGLTINSDVASINTEGALLLGLVFGDILGTNLSFDVNGLQDLAGAVTNVSELVTNAGLATAVNAIPADVLLEDVLDATSPLTSDASVALDQIIAAAINTNVNVEDVIAGVNDASVPPGSEVNTLALVRSIILNVDGSLPKDINLNTADLNGGPLGELVSGLASLTVDLTLEPAPGFVIASAKRDEEGNWPRATSVAVQADVSATLLSGLGSLDISLDTARADVELIEADCASGNDNVVDSLDVFGDADPISLSLELDLTIASVSFPGGGSSGAGINDSFNNIDLGTYGDDGIKLTKSFGGSKQGLDNLLAEQLNDMDVCVANICLCWLLSGVCNTVTSDIINPILNPIVSDILGSLLDAMGVALVPTELVLDSVSQGYTLIESGLPGE